MEKVGLVHCRMFSSTPGLYPLDVSSTVPLPRTRVWTKWQWKMSSVIATSLLWDKNNHQLERGIITQRLIYLYLPKCCSLNLSTDENKVLPVRRKGGVSSWSTAVCCIIPSRGCFTHYNSHVCWRLLNFGNCLKIVFFFFFSSGLLSVWKTFIKSCLQT